MASCGRSPWASPQNEFQRDPCPAAAVPPISSLSALLLLEVLLPPSLAPPWSSTLFTLQRRVNSHSTTVCYQPGTRREQETRGSVKTLLQLIAAAAARHRVSQRCCSSTDWKKPNTQKTQPSTTGVIPHITKGESEAREGSIGRCLLCQPAPSPTASLQQRPRQGWAQSHQGGHQLLVFLSDLLEICRTGPLHL